ncbi:MAG: hypothetical protein HFJ01_00925 [Lachnospiraceae bacterium]|nr:hypothetical protein [Lachnospiraceae bacterium]
MKKKWSSGKIVAVVLGSIGGAVIFLVTLYIGVYQFTREYGRVITYIHEAKIRQQREDNLKDRQETEKEKVRREREDDYWYDDGTEDDRDDDGYNYRYGEGEYYEIHDAIREDLSYQINFETYSSTPADNLSVEMSYPVISGDETIDSESINHIMQRELDEVKEYMESVAEWISDEESFYFEAESYVTYMDEDVLSIIYMEEGILDGATYETYIISVNIDMESGMALTNSQLLNINDTFSIDFRKRCERQNGEIDSLSFYSDQDITSLLTDDSSLIIFYTPLGMEVGFNYYYGWVTVTYQDYQDYQSHF